MVDASYDPEEEGGEFVPTKRIFVIIGQGDYSALHDVEGLTHTAMPELDLREHSKEDVANAKQIAELFQFEDVRVYEHIDYQQFENLHQDLITERETCS